MATKSAPINMRVLPSVRDVIDAAANIQKVDRTVFIQQAALNEAQKILADQKDFKLEQEAFDAFEKALDEPAKTLDGIRELFERKSPWD
ncbi:type II toxin-antitoxin system TacA family antitoxin [Vibrio superstes]|uniref:CopG family transcriptional regulator n=1 Tax=Vibrio superstes NBRC 103154 TaxID=1219062 RepID=A0A511QTZ5_9VIBR|nr:DUF1778 domain-containing protein [Vibrio superstes]GEM80833.1 hypothetical protein VSU01S_30780 [Vibrio superstes NBRC 103154]